jgi:hypothetical protein
VAAAPPESPDAGGTLESADPAIGADASGDSESEPLELEPLDGEDVLASFVVASDASAEPAGTVPASIEGEFEAGDDVVPPGLLEQFESATPVARANARRVPC